MRQKTSFRMLITYLSRYIYYIWLLLRVLVPFFYLYLSWNESLCYYLDTDSTQLLRHAVTAIDRPIENVCLRLNCVKTDQTNLNHWITTWLRVVNCYRLKRITTTTCTYRPVSIHLYRLKRITTPIWSKGRKKYA